MGTTPTYSWPYPEATDPVADGAQNIEDLALAVETTVAGTANVLQIVLGTFGQFTTTSSTPQQVTTLDITPTSSTSKIIAWVSTTCRSQVGATHVYQTAHVNINNTTSGTNVKYHDLYQELAANDNVTNSLDMWGVDEPASTSTQTYELTLYMPAISGFVRLAHGGTANPGQEGQFMLMEIAP